MRFIAFAHPTPTAKKEPGDDWAFELAWSVPSTGACDKSRFFDFPLAPEGHCVYWFRPYGKSIN
jgi:hypothetical protein